MFLRFFHHRKNTFFNRWSAHFKNSLVAPTLGPWEKANCSRQATSYPKRRRPTPVADPSFRSSMSRLDPCSTFWRRLLFQLIPVACPSHFATGDVYTLLSILRSAPKDGDYVLYNQDLAGFFTSIDQDRFLGAWYMLLDFLASHMNVNPDQFFSIYPGKTNDPGDVIKGRTFRQLNVTRKLRIGDIPDMIKAALNMQTFCLGSKCIRQLRGSPMGSPLSPALCLMVVSISEQIWSITFKQSLTSHDLFVKHVRYVDNRLLFADRRIDTLAAYDVLIHEGFYGNPSYWRRNRIRSSWVFMLECRPFELIYQGPTNLSQILSPHSASPPRVLLSGFSAPDVTSS